MKLLGPEAQRGILLPTHRGAELCHAIAAKIPNAAMARMLNGEVDGDVAD